MKYLFLLLTPFIALAAEPKAKKYTLNDLEWGKEVSGPDLTEMFIKDKGMLVLLFISNKEMNPEGLLERMKKNVEEANGKVIGVAVDTSKSSMNSKETAELLKLVKTVGLDFTVAVGMKKRPPGFARITPYCYVLNSKKVIIYSGPVGSPDFKEAMDKAAIPVESPGEKPKDAKKDEKPKADPKKAA
jgi:hypothetical protein